MKFRHLALSLVLALVTLVNPLATRTVSAQTLAGVYAVEGVNPGNGKTYRGVLEMQGMEDTYVGVWTLGKTPEGEWVEAYGYGFSYGNTFVMSVVTGDGHTLITATYDNVNGVLKGRWSVAGSGIISTETLTPSTKSAEELKLTLPAPGAVVL